MPQANKQFNNNNKLKFVFLWRMPVCFLQWYCKRGSVGDKYMQPIVYINTNVNTAA